MTMSPWQGCLWQGIVLAWPSHNFNRDSSRYTEIFNHSLSRESWWWTVQVRWIRKLSEANKTNLPFDIFTVKCSKITKCRHSCNLCCTCVTPGNCAELLIRWLSKEKGGFYFTYLPYLLYFGLFCHIFCSLALLAQLLIGWLSHERGGRKSYCANYCQLIPQDIC